MAKDAWDTKIEKAVRSRYRPTESVHELVEIVNANRGLRRVFTDLRDNASFQKLLFAQHGDLLAAEADFVVAFLPHASKTSVRKAGKRGKIALSELVTEESGGLPLQQILGLSNTEWEQVGQDAKEIAAYFVITVLRSLPDVRAVVAAEKFDYAEFRSALKSVTPENLAGVQEAAAALIEIRREHEAKGNDIHPAIVAKVQGLLDLFITRFAKNVDTVAFDLNRAFPNILYQFHLISDTWVTRILTRTKLTSTAYEDALDLLYRRELLRTHSVITWCTNCSIDNPTFASRRGKIAPSRISESSCWSCQRKEDFGAFYAIEDDLRKVMFYPDGLLAVYLAWLLEEAGLAYETQTYSKEAENDFIIEGSTLVEVKMFRGGRESRHVESSLKEAMTQLAKHTGALENDGRAVERAILVWNGPSIPEKKVLSYAPKHAAALDGIKVAIVGAADLAERVDDLRPA